MAMVVPVLALAMLSAQSPAVTACPITPHVTGYPASGPRGSNDWNANDDRTIWATFWGWDFVADGKLGEAPIEAGYTASRKVLWYKPNGYPLTVTGHRLDESAPPLLYAIYGTPLKGPIQPSHLSFPTPGCWEIDAKAGPSELRFVVQIPPGKQEKN